MVVERLRRVTRPHGFTLVELLVALAIGLIVIFAALDLLGVVGRGQERTRNRTEALAQVHVGINRMIREIHQADSAAVPAAGQLDIDVQNSDGQQIHVLYDCTQSDECRRYESSQNGDWPSAYTVAVSGVSSAEFTASPDASPTFVQLNLSLAVPGVDNPIVIDDGTALPNAVGEGG